MDSRKPLTSSASRIARYIPKAAKYSFKAIAFPFATLLVALRDTKTRNLVRDYAFCNKNHTFRIETLKHHWLTCAKTGNAYSVYKRRRLSLFLQFLREGRRHRVLEDPGSIYDYMATPEHKAYSISEAQKVIENMIVKNNIPVKGKRVLDISGGEGYFLDEFRKLGAEVVLTEFNRASIDFAKRELGIEAVHFDFSKHRLSDLLEGKFDLVFLRAAIMFCTNVEAFARDLASLLDSGAIVILQHNVVPTIGTLLVTQFDEYNYKALYQPEYLTQSFGKSGFSLVSQETEIDPTNYVYGLDHSKCATLTRMYYEFNAIKVIPKDSPYSFRHRSRDRTHLILRYDATVDEEGGQVSEQSGKGSPGTKKDAALVP